MDTKNWDKDMSPMFPAYLMFIEEFVTKDVGLLGDYTKSFQNILEIVLDHKLDPIFFSFATKIVMLADLKALRASGLLNTMLVAILKALYECQNSNSNKENNKMVIRGSLAKGTIVFFGLCMQLFSFEEFVQDVALF